jgi:hypothetical protein
MGANKLLGVSEMTSFFRFRDWEIAAIFDPPHLLKCTSNLFLKHDVENEKFEITVNGDWLTGTANYILVLKLHKVDKCNVYHQLPKVTERHIKPGAQNTLTGSWAAWVMSSTGNSYQHSGHSR